MGSLATKMKVISNKPSINLMLLLTYFVYLYHCKPLLSYEAQSSSAILSERPPISVGQNRTKISSFGGTGVIIPSSGNNQSPNSRPCKDKFSKCCKLYKASNGVLKCPPQCP